MSAEARRLVQFGRRWADRSLVIGANASGSEAELVQWLLSGCSPRPQATAPHITGVLPLGANAVVS